MEPIHILIFAAAVLLLLIVVVTVIISLRNKAKSAEYERKKLSQAIIKREMHDRKIAREDMFLLLTDDPKNPLDRDDPDDIMFAQTHDFKDYAIRVLFQKQDWENYASLLNSNNSPEMSSELIQMGEFESFNNSNTASRENTLGKQSIDINFQNNNNVYNDDWMGLNNTQMTSSGGNILENSCLQSTMGNYHQQHRSTAIQTLMTSIEDKIFVTSMIRALDPLLSAAEKSKLSALVVVTLLHRFDLVTELLTENLNVLISISVEKNSEKSFLRSHSSVYEKMVNHWLGLLMYEHLKANISEPIYMLIRALRETIFKAPVDFCTGLSRATLAQDNQMRQEICETELPTKYLSLKVQETESEGSVSLIKCMSCDTISQVKLKILLKRYGPTKSYRPDLTDFDLFYLNSNKRQLLQDFDNTNYIDQNGWKKYNTLNHYKVEDESTFLLLHKNAILQASGTFNGDTLPNPPVHHEHGLSIASFTLPPPPMFPPGCSLPRKSLGGKSNSAVSGTTTPVYPESATMPRIKNGHVNGFVGRIDSLVSSKHQSTVSMNKPDGNVLGISGYLKESYIKDEGKLEKTYHLIKKKEGVEGLEKAAVERFFHSIFSTKTKVQPETNWEFFK